MKVDQNPLFFSMVLHLETEDEEEVEPSAAMEALLNLKETKRSGLASSYTFVSFEALQSENDRLKNELHEYVVLNRFLKI